MQRGKAGNADAGGCDGEDLIDSLVIVKTVELFIRFGQERHIDVVVQEAIHLQNVSRAELALCEDLIFQQFHTKLSL
jgi:hypothetical protein